MNAREHKILHEPIQASLRLREKENREGTRLANRLTVVALVAAITAAYIIVQVNDDHTAGQAVQAATSQR